MKFRSNKGLALIDFNRNTDRLASIIFNSLPSNVTFKSHIHSFRILFAFVANSEILDFLRFAFFQVYLFIKWIYYLFYLNLY